MADFSLEDLDPADRRTLPHDHPLLDAYAHKVNSDLKLPDNLLLGLKNAGERSESTGKNSVSPMGASGVMQFMPGTAKRFNVNDPTDPLEAIDGAGRYSTHIASTLNTRDPALIAAGYNAGENRSTLKAGRIPLIPETQAYAKRVTDFVAGQPNPAAASLGFSPEDLDPADQAGAAKAQVSTTKKAVAEYSPLSDSAIENMLAGWGKSVHDLGTGTAQLLGDTLVNPASRALTGRNLIPDMKPEVDAADARDGPLMKSGAGMAGYGVGSLLNTALPGSWLGKLGTLAKAGPLAQLFGSAATAGAGISAASPVGSDDTRLGNMATGAVVGPLGAVAGKGLGVAAKYMGNTTVGKDVVDGAKILASKIPMPAVLARPSWSAAATEPERAAVGAAMDQGVPVYGSQLKTPGAPLSKGRASEQRDSFDRAVARSFGENTDDLVAAFPAANERMGNVYNTLFDSKKIQLGKDHLKDLADISAYNASRSPRFAPNAELQDAITRAEAAAQGNPVMTGKDYQDSLKQYKAAMAQMGKSTETRPADYHAMEGVSMLIDSLNKQAGKTLSKEELALFGKTNKEWRNMAQLESLAPRDANGNISPKQLAALLARKRKGEFTYGKGDQTLPNLARYGNTYMGLNANAPTGVVATLKNTLKQSAPYGLATLGEGALIGSQLDSGDKDGLIGKITPYGVGLAAAAMLNKGASAAFNPKLLPKDLLRPRGALSELAGRVNPAAATALTWDAEKGQ